MDIHERTVGSVVVLDLHGRLAAGDGAGRLKDRVHSVTHQGRRQVLLNLAGDYDAARDGRFVINTVLEDVASPITLLQNWRPEAKP